MKYIVYQINLDRDENRLAFTNYKLMTKLLGSVGISQAFPAYDKVWEGDLPDCNRLEDLFYKLNMDHPADYRARSLSVSDIVEMEDGKCWFCDSFGWVEVDRPVPEAER